MATEGQATPEGEFPLIKGLEKLKDEKSPLTDEQEKEQTRIVEALGKEYEEQKNEQSNKAIMRKRQQFVHVHSMLGGERAVDAVMAIKSAQMAGHGMAVCILNLNFLKRLQTRALYMFLKERLVKSDERAYSLVFLKIQEEDADEEDRQSMLDELKDKAEDAPLFVLTDETCKEAERIDDVISFLTQPDTRFHFWSSSAYAHGTPGAARRYRLASQQECPPAVKQVMDMIDIDDDDIEITGTHHVPLRKLLLDQDEDEEYNIRLHLHELPVRLISHNRTHSEQDVWECGKCGSLLADYLNDEIGIGKPGLDFNEVFIVGSITRFESLVSISGLQVALLEKDIVSEVLFCRRAVRVQDMLKTTNKIVVSDSVSLRGVDKKIVIIIPSPRPKEQQEEIERELQRRREMEEKAREEQMKREKMREEEERRLREELAIFPRPIPRDKDDEEVLYRRKAQPDDNPDGADEFRRPLDLLDEERDDEEDEEEEEMDENDDVGEEDEAEGDGSDGSFGSSDGEINLDELPEQPLPSQYQLRPEDIARADRYSDASHQSLLRRSINSISRFDKEMILDLFTDAPRHAVVFHFADDDNQIEPEDD